MFSILVRRYILKIFISLCPPPNFVSKLQSPLYIEVSSPSYRHYLNPFSMHFLPLFRTFPRSSSIASSTQKHTRKSQRFRANSYPTFHFILSNYPLITLPPPTFSQVLLTIKPSFQNMFMLSQFSSPPPTSSSSFSVPQSVPFDRGTHRRLPRRNPRPPQSS